jgi:hypothetical protein
VDAELAVEEFGEPDFFGFADFDFGGDDFHQDEVLEHSEWEVFVVFHDLVLYF